MYNNIGAFIMKLSGAVSITGYLISIFIGALIISMGGTPLRVAIGILVILLGFFVSFIIGVLLIGFGKLIDDTEKCKNIFSKSITEAVISQVLNKK